MLYFDAMITLKLTPTNYLVLKSYEKQKYGVEDMIMIFTAIAYCTHYDCPNVQPNIVSLLL